MWNIMFLLWICKGNIPVLTFSDIQNVLESVGSNITSFTKSLPVEKIIADFTMYLSQSEAYVQDYFPVVEQYDFYR